MTVSRRDVALAIGLASAIAASSAVSACSPPPEQELGELPGHLFAMIAQRKLDEAKELVAADVRLSLMTTESQELFAGPANVVGTLSNLMHSKGLGMIGDSAEYAPGGMYWRILGPWICSDMLKGRAVDFSDTCNGGTGPQTILNVYVRLDESGDRVAQILLLESNHLVLQLSNEPALPSATN